MSPKIAVANTTSSISLAVIIPCYRERNHILDVISDIGEDVGMIFVVDDACPDRTGEFVEENCSDERVTVIRNRHNLGVGGATMRGYEAAIEAGADVLIKIDGDGQMDTSLIPDIVQPIVAVDADYAKGNRLHQRDAARDMPLIRLFGNRVLTLMSKVSSGYWSIKDPTNGFTAIHSDVAAALPFDEISEGFFFESDMLCKLSTLDAVVRDVPMLARYGNEQSHLSVRRVFWPFLLGHIRNSFRRVKSTYFVNDISIASVELVFGVLLLAFGGLFGGYKWWVSISSGIPATAGTVVLAALPILIGFQLLLAFIGHDTRRVPSAPIHPHLRRKADKHRNID